MNACNQRAATRDLPCNRRLIRRSVWIALLSGRGILFMLDKMTRIECHPVDSVDDMTIIERMANSKTRSETMTPAAIQNKIESLKVSRKNQINVEFEGYDPGHDMPQDRKIAELINELHEGGNIIVNDEIYSRDEIQTIREAFNGKVKQFMADNPGQGVPTATMQKWEKEVGMKCHQIKNAVSTLGL